MCPLRRGISGRVRVSLAGIVLALVAYGVVELVMNAVVNPGIEIDSVPQPDTGGGDSSPITDGG